MRVLFLLGLVGLCLGVSVEDTVSSFAQFKETFGRNYANDKEEAQRFDCFVKTLANIEHLNKVDDAHHAVNKFSDLCEEEFKAFHSLKFENITLDRPDIYSHAEVAATAGAYDWRDHGAVVGVKNQRQCGSCWAFSTVASLEAAWKLSGKSLTSFSEEELVQCAKSAGNGCQGGEMKRAIQWVISHGGINTEAAYPYTSGTGITGSCNNQKASVSVGKFSRLLSAPSSETQIATFLVKNGPLAIAVDANDGWQTYHSGIKTKCSGRSLDHGVSLVGYGSDYWIIKNSWGTTWGESGYIRVKKGVNCDGMTSDVSTAQV